MRTGTLHSQHIILPIWDDNLFSVKPIDSLASDSSALLGQMQTHVRASLVPESSCIRCGFMPLLTIVVTALIPSLYCIPFH